ncbi:BRO-N domain-containing protein [Histophilus somni]|uniref:BRO-N domain-containing protein n=1 Tax=Histophilus somni TaxID=731 RepID=UPI00094AD083
MSNKVQFPVFNFNSSQVRVIVDPNQEPWFCGADVCRILGYVNESLTLQKHCKENGVSKRYLTDKMQRQQEAIFINEPNLYRLIIKSRKPEAEKFEAWVFEEVLPQLRKTGKYALQNSAENQPLADRKTTVDDRTGLRNAVNMLVSKKGLLYNEAYNLVHHYMNVESIEDIPADKLQSAVEYVHKICLEGELIITPPKIADRDEITISAELFEAIMKHTRLAKKLAEQTEIFHRQLFLMLGLERHIRNDIGALSYDVAHEFNPWLQKGEEILATHNPLALPRF